MTCPQVSALRLPDAVAFIRANSAKHTTKNNHAYGNRCAQRIIGEPS